jgi:nitroreductase
MELMEAVEKRKSIRAYLPDPVGKEIIEKLLRAAMMAPSGSNSQPWKFYVVTGTRKKALDEVLLRCLEEGRKTSNELQVQREGGDEKAQEKINSRRSDLTKAIMNLLVENDLPLEMFAKGSFTYFGAPVAIFVTMDQSLGENNLVSIGAAVENLLLAACDNGLGTCWIGMALMYAKEIKENLGIPDTERIVSSLALGYPDEAAPINSFKAGRDDFDSFTEWIGWQ